MASHIKALSATKLKQLLNRFNGTCTIMYMEFKKGIKRVLLEGYPKQVGIAFSKLFVNTFPPVNKLRLADLTSPKSNEVVIVGGSLEDHKLILTWMLSCCGGHGLQDFPTARSRRFTRYFLIREAAQVLGVSYVEELMAKRMADIKAQQVHSEDIRALYQLLGREHALVKEIVEQTARKMAKGFRAMKAYNVYTTLALEHTEFGEDIKRIWDAARDEHKPLDNAEKARTKKAHAAHKTSKDMRGRKADVRFGNNIEQARNQEDRVVHKTIQAEKRGNGRALLPLAELGVGRGSFYQSLELQGPRRQSNKKGSGQGRRKATARGEGSFKSDAHKGEHPADAAKTPETSSADDQKGNNEVHLNIIRDIQTKTQTEVSQAAEPHSTQAANTRPAPSTTAKISDPASNHDRCQDVKSVRFEAQTARASEHTRSRPLDISEL